MGLLDRRVGALAAFLLCSSLGLARGEENGWTPGGSNNIGFTWDRDRGQFRWDGSPGSFRAGNRLRLFVETPEYSGLRAFTKLGADWIVQGGTKPKIEWLEGNLTWRRGEPGSQRHAALLYSRQKQHRTWSAVNMLTSWERSGEDDGVHASVAGGRFGEGLFLQSEEGGVQDVRISRRMFYYGWRGNLPGSEPRPWRSRANLGVTYLEYVRRTSNPERQRSVILGLDLLLPLPLPNRPALMAQLSASETRVGPEQGLWPDGEFYLPSWRWGRAEPGRWSSLLPSNAAFRLEIRNVRLASERWGSLGLTAGYRALREDFENPWQHDPDDLIAPIGPTLQAWYAPPERKAVLIYFNGRDERSAREDARVRDGQLSATARFSGGYRIEILGRGRELSRGVSESEQAQAFLRMTTDRGRALQRWSLGYGDTAPREQGALFGWETRLRLSSTLIYYHRLLATGSLDGGRTWAFFSVQFRPNAKSTAFLTYGPPNVGDGPFPLFDRDLLTGGAPLRVWSLTFRVWM